jgi:hypothetical protein
VLDAWEEAAFRENPASGNQIEALEQRTSNRKI